ncbi:hypothetical protein C8J55DRAFT_566261 [Lentinula edodes]|uniref:Uncharacterized protein n=1 Tax=Lentinula lateritia TaxID=40482 RepID=A0A9W8ZSG3_9AGAR|nr:hypothetical protein C8J55DRAFT_566261 [Lentinula edodes]
MSSIPTLDPSTLLGCRNAPPKCQNICGMFFPENGQYDGLTPLTKCVVCDCFAASHIHPISSTPNIKTAAQTTEESSKPKPFPSGSATAETISSSRPNIKNSTNFSASPFRDHVKQRDQRRDEGSADTKVTSESTPEPQNPCKRRFEPADAERKEKFENITGRPKKKKKTSASATFKTPAPGPPPAKPTEFHIGLYGKPSFVDHGTAKRPSLSEWQILWTADRIRKIFILPDATHADIMGAIEVAFGDFLPPVAEHTIRFRILQSVVVGRGQSAILKLLESDSLTVNDLLVASLTTRPKGVPIKLASNLVYITLPAGAADIDEVVKSPKEPIKSRKGKKYCSKPMEVSDDSNSEESDQDSGKEESNDTQVLTLQPPEFNMLKRLIYNMHGPKGTDVKYDWWSPASKCHWIYIGFGSTGTRAAKWLEKIEDMINHSKTSDPAYQDAFTHMAEILQDNILSDCEMLVNLASTISVWTPTDYDTFTTTFALGPSGMDLLVTCLEKVYSKAEAAGPFFLTQLAKDFPNIHKGICELPNALLVLVEYFRKNTLRELWDPKNGFSELLAILRNSGEKLPLGSLTSLFRHDLSSIDLRGFSYHDIREGLQQAFGHLSNSSRINVLALSRGTSGLHGFYSEFVEHVLDKMSNGRQQYNKIYNLFATLCQALVHAIEAFLQNRSQSTSPNIPLSASTASPTPTTAHSSHSRIAAATKFADRALHLTWATFVHELMRDFPHPLLSKRVQANALQGLPKRKQAIKLLKAYHPDQNVNATSEWREITLILAQAIGAAHV